MSVAPVVGRLLARLSAAFAIGCATLAGLGLILWYGGELQRVKAGLSSVPMAPSTSALMLLLGVAGFLHSRSGRGRIRITERGCAVMVLVGATIVWLQFVFGFSLRVESWLAGSSATAGGIPLGRMSPLTAVCFCFSAGALLVRGSMHRLEGWLALGVFAVSGLIVAGYVAGSPFLYGGSTIPMPLLTALGFNLFSVAVLLGAGGGAWPVRMFVREWGAARPGLSRRIEWPLVLATGIMTAGITLLGLRYLNVMQDQARADAWQELETIADLKVAQIVNWRRERLLDAELIRAMPYAARRALDAMADTNSATTRQMFTGWIEPKLKGVPYERVFLLDADLNVRLVHPDDGSRQLAQTVRAAAEQALRRMQVTVADLYRAPDSSTHLEFLVPLVVRREASGENVPAAGLEPSLADRGAGVLILRVNAQDFLFPLIQKWPTASRTAETVLVRKDAEDVLFLNELRHHEGPAMSLRRPLNDVRLPAGIGLRGRQGVLDGLDYRGIEVVAAIRAVPGTPWVMVAKVDATELYEPLRQHAISVVSVALALVLAGSLGVTALWRRRNEHYLRGQLASERERRVLAERYEHLMSSANDAIVLSDEANSIIEVNDRACELYGYSEVEFQGLPLIQLRSPELREDFVRRAEVLRVTGHEYFETRHVRKNGSVFPVEISSRLVQIGGARYKLGIIRDITDRKTHEAEIDRLNRLYATLSEVNQTIVRCQSRQELFDDICRIAVDLGQFRAGWISWQPTETEPRVTVAQRAIALPSGLIMPGWKGGCGVVAEALRTGRACLCTDARTDDRAICCREVLATLEVRACASFPLRLRGQVRGGFSICSIEPSFFNQAEMQLLEEVATDISFALDKLDKEEQRVQAEEALRQSEAFTRTVLDSLPVGVAVNSVDPGVSFSYMNDNFPRFYRTTRERLAEPDAFWEAVYEEPGFRDEIRKRVLEDCASGKLERMHWSEIPITRKGTETCYITARNIPVPGRRMVISLVWDVTERRRLRQERRTIEAHLRQQQKLESMGTLAGGVAHEINNPINGIMNYAQLIQDRLAPDSPLTEFTREIIHETQRVTGIVRNLLTFARDEKQSHSPARIADIIEGTLSLIRTLIRHDHITLQVSVPEELPILKCRSQQIQQVLMNLMTNARDALNQRYPGDDPNKLILVTAKWFTKQDRGWIRVTVEDHGTGITPAVRERMFDPFFTTKPRDQGTGLGLAISHGIVKEHHGELTLETEPGQFTRMHLDLPVDNGWNVLNGMGNAPH